MPWDLKICRLQARRFVPFFGRPPELTEEVQEGLAVLSQIVYTENYVFLAIDRTPPTMAVRIERKFRRELQVRVLRWVCL
jgi:hypothetical protein